MGYFLPSIFLNFQQFGDYVFGMIILVIWPFLEAYLISTWGTTPGKWLLRIKISDKNDRYISYYSALKRSYMVFLRGLGLGIPIVCFITQILSYSELKKNGITSWDNDLEIKISHGEISVFRGLFVVFLVIVILLIYLIASVIETLP